jgi:2-polyprenyl-6-methoxyphenol hydroxylase-like FAD-dependent oxidoreductase
MADTKALIIGGGIGGLATALSLRKAGLTVEVFERAPALEEVGAGIALWANGLRALDRLGVGEAVRAAGRLHDGGAIRSANGRVLLDLAGFSLPGGEGGGWLGCMTHRADLLSVLADAVGASTVHTGREFQRLELRQDRVTAAFSDGSVAEGDVLVGADGIHSEVRASLQGPVPLRYAGYTVWRWVAAFDEARVLTGETWGAGARFGQAALPGNRVYAYAAADAAPGGRGAAGERRELERLFGSWHDPIPALIEAADPEAILRHDCYDMRPLRAWGSGRCTLLGDAAHAMTPNLGQGACQALEDAVVLGRCVAPGGDVSAALRAYERERRRRTARFQNRSRSAGAMGQWASPLAVRTRSFLARRLLPHLQRAQMREMLDVEL